MLGTTASCEICEACLGLTYHVIILIMSIISIRWMHHISYMPVLYDSLCVKLRMHAAPSSNRPADSVFDSLETNLSSTWERILTVTESNQPVINEEPKELFREGALRYLQHLAQTVVAHQFKTEPLKASAKLTLCLWHIPRTESPFALSSIFFKVFMVFRGTMWMATHIIWERGLIR